MYCVALKSNQKGYHMQSLIHIKIVSLSLGCFRGLSLNFREKLCKMAVM